MKFNYLIMALFFKLTGISQVLCESKTVGIFKPGQAALKRTNHLAHVLALPIVITSDMIAF